VYVSMSVSMSVSVCVCVCECFPLSADEHSAPRRRLIS